MDNDHTTQRVTSRTARRYSTTRTITGGHQYVSFLSDLQSELSSIVYPTRTIRSVQSRTDIKPSQTITQAPSRKLDPPYEIGTTSFTDAVELYSHVQSKLSAISSYSKSFDDIASRYLNYTYPKIITSNISNLYKGTESRQNIYVWIVIPIVVVVFLLLSACRALRLCQDRSPDEKGKPGRRVWKSNWWD